MGAEARLTVGLEDVCTGSCERAAGDADVVAGERLPVGCDDDFRCR